MSYWRAGARRSVGISWLARRGRAARFRSAESKRPSRHRLHVGAERQLQVRLARVGLQRNGDDLGDLADEVNRQLLPQVGGQIFLDVLFVLPRQDQFGDAVAP